MRILMTLLLIALSFAPNAGAVEEPLEISLDGEWDFTWTPTSTAEIPTLPEPYAFDVTIQVPGAWDDQLDRFRTATWWEKAIFTTSIDPVRYLSGIGWHRCQIDAPITWRGRAVQLTIGAAVGDVHVWLNGKHVGMYDYGVYTPYSVDVSDSLAFGQPNELIVSIDNTRGFAGGWAFIGNAGKATGLVRPVSLRVSPSNGHVADMYLRPGKDLREVHWEIDIEFPEDGPGLPASVLEWRVEDVSRETVLIEGETKIEAFNGKQTVSWDARAEGILPWSPKNPNLYWAEVQWRTTDGRVLDKRVQRFGLRRWSHEGRKLFLNGNPIYLRGEFGAYYYPVHCTTPMSKEYWRKHIRRAKQIGMNYINFAARVCPVEMMEVADEEGIVLQCGDHMTVLQQHREAYEEVWRPIVLLTRRYPSMCFYGFGGERNYYEGIIEQYQKQYDLIKSLHPESMVMPQQAIRGIDYAFDEKGKKELTPEPFPHHAERLVRYTKACDLFGHYSGGAFGYNYFADRWQEMEKRFLIYDKPLFMHELYMGMSYLNPDNAAKYSGRVPPYLYTGLLEDLVEAGLEDRWKTFFENSARLNAICQKYCVEKTRKCNELAGFEFLGMTDMHFCPHYTVGILDEFGGLKPGSTVESILRYNDESVLLLDFADGSMNRSYWAGDHFGADIMVSLFGVTAITAGTLTWELKIDGKTVLIESQVLRDISNGQVSAIGRVDLDWPAVNSTTRFNLSASLAAPGYNIANDWDFWVFPRKDPPKFTANGDDHILKMLGGRYESLNSTEKPEDRDLLIVSKVTEREIEHLANGSDVVLLGADPFYEYTSWRSFRPGLGAREHHNIGSVIAQHPVFDDLPHEGWGDWQFYPVLEGASCIQFEETTEIPFNPILEIISSAEDVRKQAAIFELRTRRSDRTEAGRLFVSTCVFDENNPSCVALMDGILRYVAGGEFQPEKDIPLDLLTRMTVPPDPSEPANLVANPSFEAEENIRRSWGAYGGDYTLDTANAYSGEQSLKLTITPQQLKNNRHYHTGTMAKRIRFKETPPLMKLGAWHRAENLSGAKGRDFLIFIYIDYKEGGQYTLRLSFESGTHDWRYSEVTWKPEKEVASATLYVGMAHKTGTGWVDDIYFGAAPANVSEETTEASIAWSREPVAVEFAAEGMYQIEEGEWKRGARVTVSQEGRTTVTFKKDETDEAPEVRTIGIDITPPTITLDANPLLTQEGGLYHGAPQTAFAFTATDSLSGVRALEVSLDGGGYVSHESPIYLPPGEHELRCRATDHAGNSSQTITGPSLTGGETDTVQVVIRDNDSAKEDLVQEVMIPSSVDGVKQPVALYIPPGAEKGASGEPVPLLVSLHSWSAGHDRYDSFSGALEGCRERGWVFLSPHFRGPNNRPEACASDLAVQDILDAVTYARESARVDPKRIYILGGSGGGHIALVMSHRAPELWAGVSAWVPVTDLAAWHSFCAEKGHKYARDVELCIGGLPNETTTSEECRRRSPLFWLSRAKGVPIDIQTGIRDGHGGAAIPIDHSLRAFNVLAEANGHPSAMLSPTRIEIMTREKRVPPELAGEDAKEPGRKHAILFRRAAGPVRLTLFDGAHESDPPPALDWLESQRKP